MRSVLNFLGAVLLTIGLAACASVPDATAYFNSTPNRPYTLASGDRLRVLVFGQDQLSNSYDVDSTGSIEMPLIGSVHAKGLTTHGLERVIADKLRDGYIRDPKVAVEVQAYRPFFILGEVTTAGQYPYINGMTVENAIAVAGGYTPRASHGAVIMTRIIDGRSYTGTVPTTEPVHPGDSISVRERLF
ncbi:MAG: polysaccharide export protein [Hyphomicrobiales bacterium]|nr:polysaccharide export protein [Hyphomicrobiales bacterium]